MCVCVVDSLGVGIDMLVGEVVAPSLTNLFPLPPPPTELADLRAKFEEDKKRVAALRESRRFRPS